MSNLQISSLCFGASRSDARKAVDATLDRWKKQNPHLTQSTRFKIVPAVTWWNHHVAPNVNDGSAVTAKVLFDAFRERGLQTAATSSMPIPHRHVRHYVERVKALNPRRPIRITDFVKVIKHKLNIDIDWQALRHILLNAGLQIRSRGGNTRTHQFESYLDALKKRCDGKSQSGHTQARVTFINPGLKPWLEKKFGRVFTYLSIKHTLKKKGFKWFSKSRYPSLIRRLATSIIAENIEVVKALPRVQDVSELILNRTKLPISDSMTRDALKANGISFQKHVTKRAQALIVAHAATVQQLDSIEATSQFLHSLGLPASWNATKMALGRAQITLSTPCRSTKQPKRRRRREQRLPPPEHVLATPQTLLGPQTKLGNVANTNGQAGQPNIAMPDPKALGANTVLLQNEANKLLREGMQWLESEEPQLFQIVQLCHIQELPTTTVAQQLGLNVNDVEQGLKAGFRMLRGFFN